MPDEARFEVSLLDTSGSELDEGAWLWAYRWTEDYYAGLP